MDGPHSFPAELKVFIHVVLFALMDTRWRAEPTNAFLEAIICSNLSWPFCNLLISSHTLHSLSFLLVNGKHYFYLTGDDPEATGKPKGKHGCGRNTILGGLGKSCGFNKALISTSDGPSTVLGPGSKKENRTGSTLKVRFGGPGPRNR